MRQFSLLLFISVFLFISMKSYSSNPFIDSLDLEVKDRKGEVKLEAMFQIANRYVFTDKLYTIGEWIEKEAIKQDNLRYIAGSYNLKARYYLQRRFDSDSTVYYAKLANSMYDDNNIKNTNLGHWYIVKAYLEKGYYALAISYLSDLLETNNSDVYFNLEIHLVISNIFGLLNDNEVAIEYLETIRNSTTFAPILTPSLIYSSYIQTGQHYLYMKMYDKSFSYFSKADSVLQNNDKTMGPHYFEYLFQVTVNILDIYIEKKEIEVAQKQLVKLKNIAKEIDLTQSQKTELQASEAQCFLLTGEYRKALPLLKKSKDSVKKYMPSQVHFITRITQLEIECLQRLALWNEALDVQSALMQYNDSIYKQNFSTLPYQIAKLSETQKLLKVRLERKRDQAILEKSRIINIILIFAFVLLGTMFYIVRRNLKKTKEKNKILVKQYSELERYKNVFKDNLIFSKEKNEQSAEPTLYQQIETYIEQNEAYRDPNINREVVARAINTNENYVAKAIKKMTGKTFVEYINQYRLEYSRQRLLADISEPVKVILQDAGFSSEASFYRLFKDAYGMSSSEMRKAKEELEKDLEKE